MCKIYERYTSKVWPELEKTDIAELDEISLTVDQGIIYENITFTTQADGEWWLNPPDIVPRDLQSCLDKTYEEIIGPIFDPTEMRDLSSEEMDDISYRTIEEDEQWQHPPDEYGIRAQQEVEEGYAQMIGEWQEDLYEEECREALDRMTKMLNPVPGWKLVTFISSSGGRRKRRLPREVTMVTNDAGDVSYVVVDGEMKMRKKGGVAPDVMAMEALEGIVSWWGDRTPAMLLEILRRSW